jgi:hypothetical protein
MSILHPILYPNHFLLSLCVIFLLLLHQKFIAPVRFKCPSATRKRNSSQKLRLETCMEFVPLYTSTLYNFQFANGHLGTKRACVRLIIPFDIHLCVIAAASRAIKAGGCDRFSSLYFVCVLRVCASLSKYM